MADYVALAVILGAALYLFWQHELRTDVTALLVTLALILPWPHPNGPWRSILTYQEGFSGFGSLAVVMVVSMFVFGGGLCAPSRRSSWGCGFFACVRGTSCCCKLRCSR